MILKKFYIFRFFEFLEKKQKLKFNLLIILTTIVFFIEYLSLISLPILASFISNNYTFIEKFSNFFNISYSFSPSNSKLVIYSVIFTIFIFLFKNIFLILLNIFQFNFFKKLKINFGIKIFSKFIDESFLNIVLLNPSELTRDVADELDNFLNYYSHLLILFREILAIMSIFLILFFVNFFIVLSVVISLSLISIIYFKKIKPIITNRSQENQNFRKKIIQTLNESNGLIKEIKILRKENEFIERFKSIKTPYENNLYLFEIIQRVPKFLLEIVVVSFLVILSFIYLIIFNDQSTLFAILPLLVVSFFRFIPAFNGITNSITYLKIYQPSVELLLNKIKKNDIFLKEKKPISKPQNNNFFYLRENYKNYIRVDKISFKYKKNYKYIFQNLSTSIDKGSKFGIIGSSGSGKTTLFNIMLGLIYPDKGNILFKDDNIFENLLSWRKKIGYVSQDIYLLDASVKENITLTLNSKKYNKNALDKAIDLSNLKNKILSMPDGINTKIGNDGAQLSGGEKQRIALARAIYINPEIFFLDEPTSSLDSKTEEIIMNNLVKYFNNKTIISIAHKKSTIDRCDKIFDLNSFKN